MRLLIVEDDRLIADHILSSLRIFGEFTTIDVAGDLAEARLLTRTLPDCLILDLNLPDGFGHELIAELRARDAAVPKILVLTVLGDEDSVVGALAAGADGYVLKDESMADVASSIRKLLDGGSPLSASIAIYILRHLRQTEPHRVAVAPGTDMTAREIELLRLFARGHSNKEAAAALGLSPHTVGDYVKSIYRKLRVSSRGEALMRAASRGIIGVRP